MADFVWGDNGAMLTPESIAARRKVGEALQTQGMDFSPVKHWTQGLARVAQAVLGNMDMASAAAAEQRNVNADKEFISGLSGGGAAAAPVSLAPTVATPAGAGGTPADAIASIESGGKYDILGPVTKTGDRAHGKYQIMGANIGPWSKEALGQEVTPEQFLADPKIQDAVFQHKFGQYSQKYGPEGAARAWFAGEGGMNDLGRKDQLGTTVGDYGKRFSAALTPGVQKVAAAYAPEGDGALPIKATPAVYQAPAAAAPVQAAPAPAAPGVQAVASAAPGMNPKLLAAITSPYASEGVKKIATLMLQHQMQGDGVTTVDLGNSVGVMDKRGNIVRQLPKGEPNKGPEFGEIGTNTQTGEKMYGWKNPRDQSVTPYNPPAAQPGQASTIPPVPPGVDPKIWREAHSKNAASDAMPAPFDDVNKVRNELAQRPAYKNIAQAAPIYKAMADTAGRDTKASDLNLVYGLGKIMDPTSVVREGEIHMANDTQGWADKLNGMIKGIQGEGRLRPEARAEIMKEAHGRMSAYDQMYKQDADFYRGIAKRGRMNPEDIVQDFGKFEPWTPPEVPPAVVAPVAPIQPQAAPRIRIDANGNILQ